MFQYINNQPEEQMDSWVGWERGKVVWRSPVAPVSHTLHFQDSVNARAGVFLPWVVQSTDKGNLFPSTCLGIG